MNQTEASDNTRKTKNCDQERCIRPRLEASTGRAAPNNEDEEISEDPCVICLESLSRGFRTTGSVMPCRHSYHEDCLAGWRVSLFETQNKLDTDSFRCPVCRQPVEEFVPNSNTEPKTHLEDEEETEESQLCTLLQHDLWSSDVKVVEKALNELYYDIVKNDEVAHILAMNRMGGFVPLIRAMERHSASVGVQRKSLCFLQYMVEYHADAIFYSPGAVDAIFAAMKNHPNDMLTLACACITLDKFIKLSDNGKAVALTIKRKGGIPAAIYALRRFPENAQLQSSAYGLLASLCSEIENPNPTEFAKEGTIPLVIQAMKDHPAVAKLQRCACILLCKLAHHDESRKVIVDNGGLQAIRETRKKYSDNDGVERAIRSALSRLEGL